MKNVKFTGPRFVPGFLLPGITYLLFLFCCLLATPAVANVRLPQIFGDNMVLQRDSPAIWGQADPGEKVTVAIGTKKIRVVAGKDGRWKVIFPALKQKGVVEVIVTGKNKINYRNVLLGDVWIGGGQSNMAWQLKHMENAEAEIAAANFPDIRLFTVKNIGSAYTSQDELTGQWVECNPKTAGEFSATLYFFGINLYREYHQPLGLIVDAWGGSRIQSWIPLDELRKDNQTRREVDSSLSILDNASRLQQYNDLQITNWQKRSADAVAKGQTAPAKPAPASPLGRDRPGGLYNSMIAPLLGLGIKGLVWYQGEFNASDADQYARLLPMLVDCWRKNWQMEFPVVVIQLPNVNQPLPVPSESPWARLREAQLKVLSLKNTAVTITLDTGDGDLHPKTKRKLSERAALSALRIAYNKDVKAAAPLYDSYRIEDNKIRLFFRDTASGLASKNNSRLTGFTIAGGDHRFVNAEAILDGNTILVWNNDISIPVAVRYAWAQYPVCNLYNRSELPVSTFRTDNWPVNQDWVQEDSSKKAGLNRLLQPDYSASPLKDWEKVYSDFSFKVSQKAEHVLPYRFYSPTLEPGKKYPLVLLMHGAGERGFDNRLQLMRLKSLPFWLQYPCFVLAPQCPAKPADKTDGESVWVKTSFGAPAHTMNSTPTWPLQMTMELLDTVLAKYPVDMNRIYVTGLSMGGFATWELIQRAPEKFAAAIPVCGGGDTALASRLSHIPIWVFHGDADPTVPVQRSRGMVRSITRAGGTPKYTEYPGVGHGAWAPTYNDPKIWEWLFSQLKKQEPQ